LLGRFDSFGNDIHIQCLGQHDDGADNTLIFLAHYNFIDECLIDLYPGY